MIPPRSNATIIVHGGAASWPVGHETTPVETTGSSDDAEARRAELIADYKERFANPYAAAERGYVDEVIEPRRTRPVLIDALQTAITKRERTPPRKHGNIPL